MSEPDFVPLCKRLCFSVYSASHAFTRAYRHFLEPLGLTYPQYLVMLVLWERDDIRVKAIGEKLYLDSGTLTPLLKRLENLGLVRRVRDVEDERQVSILLTAVGHDLQAKAAHIPHDLQCMSQLNVEDLDALTKSITALRDNLQAATGGVLTSA